VWRQKVPDKCQAADTSQYESFSISVRSRLQAD
jgi:hypothetical protein